MSRCSSNMTPRRRRLAVLAGIAPALSSALLGIGTHYGPRLTVLQRHVYDGAVIVFMVVLFAVIIANLAATRRD